MRLAFMWLLGAVTLVKVFIAARLPLFVDEAFYWLEGQHLAAAYSDLPGMTAWLVRLGVEVGGNHVLAVRAPFLLLSLLVPWLVVRIAAREFGPAAGWQAGCWAVLLPLAGSLGLLAVPDPVMAVATLLCVDAIARMLRGVEAASALQLGLGLALGALSHYRFLAVIGVGFIALLLLADGRRALRDVRTWVAIALGASAWIPLLAWNVDNADAGLRFQLVDRHPWAFHADGLWFIAVQALLVTPLLFAALGWAAWRGRRGALAGTRLFAALGGLLVLGFFVLGFFADTERVSFHWPLPGYLALLPLLPAALPTWPRGWRIATWAVAGLGLVAVLGYYLAVSTPGVRARTAAEKWYPSNFAGWEALADAVRDERARMPPGTRLVAGNFKVGAELGFALGDTRIPVLDHPLNTKHGRAPQLHLWGLRTTGRAQWGAGPVLLVVDPTDVQYKALLAHYHALCRAVGPLPAPRVLNIDHGRQRFLLFRLEAARGGACTTPAMAWIDAPIANAAVQGEVDVRGWAFKDGVGVARVDVLLDGRPIAQARYGLPSPGTAAYWRISTDPNHPDVGFAARVDLSGVPRGRHWLGLRLHGADGSVEDWPEQPLRVK